MRIADMHCDTLLDCYKKGVDLRKNSLHIDLERMKKNNAMVQFFAAFLPSGEMADEENIHKEPYQLFIEMSDLYEKELEKNSDMIRPVLKYSDLLRNNDEGKMSAVLTIEDGLLLEGRIERLDELYERGIRLITLTWNYENCIGYPNSTDREKHMKGLKPFGIETVKRMNELGMIIDVSHLSEGGFYDVVKYSEKPFVASHSCAAALCGHSRNLTDQQLRSIAESGGVAGVNFYSKFLKDSAEKTFAEDIIEHIKYMVKIAGEDHVGLGSDFDGIDCGLEVEGYDFMQTIMLKMEKYFKSSTIEKICYKNVMRVLKECL